MDSNNNSTSYPDTIHIWYAQFMMNNAMKIEFLIIFSIILFLSILLPNIFKIKYLLGRKLLTRKPFYPFTLLWTHKTILRKLELNKTSLCQSHRHINTDRFCSQKRKPHRQFACAACSQLCTNATNKCMCMVTRNA